VGELVIDTYPSFDFLRNIHALPVEPIGMSDDLIVREGERIPRRPLYDYSEADSFVHAIKRDGIRATLFEDSNQYGPLAMLLALLCVATVTGGLIKFISTVSFVNPFW